MIYSRNSRILVLSLTWLVICAGLVQTEGNASIPGVDRTRYGVGASYLSPTSGESDGWLLWIGGQNRFNRVVGSQVGLETGVFHIHKAADPTNHNQRLDTSPRFATADIRILFYPVEGDWINLYAGGGVGFFWIDGKEKQEGNIWMDSPRISSAAIGYHGVAGIQLRPIERLAVHAGMRYQPMNLYHRSTRLKNAKTYYEFGIKLLF